MIQKIKDAYNSLPEWVQKAMTDFISAAVVTLGGLGLAFPHSFDDAKAEAITVAVALGPRGFQRRKTRAPFCVGVG